MKVNNGLQEQPVLSNTFRFNHFTQEKQQIYANFPPNDVQIGAATLISISDKFGPAVLIFMFLKEFGGTLWVSFIQYIFCVFTSCWLKFSSKIAAGI